MGDLNPGENNEAWIAEFTYLAIDGTKSQDANTIAKEFNDANIENLCKALANDDPVKVYVKKEKKKIGGKEIEELFAINFQKNSYNDVPVIKETGSDVTLNDVRDIFYNAGVELSDGFTSSDIFYSAMHAYLEGDIGFHPKDGDDEYHKIFNPATDKSKIKWDNAKWVILASCGSLSPHYRYFGVPPSHPTDNDWAHSVSINKQKFYAIIHHYPLLHFFSIVKDLEDFHGMLGYWNKSPGGDVGGTTPDMKTAKDFVNGLSEGKPVVLSWKEGNTSWEWAALFKNKYRNETLSQLQGESEKGAEEDDDAADYYGQFSDDEWMYADRFHLKRKDDGSIDKPEKLRAIPLKQAFIEANLAENYTVDPYQYKGAFQCHKFYDYRIMNDSVDELGGSYSNRSKYFPSDLGKHDTVIEEFSVLGKFGDTLYDKSVRKKINDLLETDDDDIKTLYNPIRILLTAFTDFQDMKNSTEKAVSKYAKYKSNQKVEDIMSNKPVYFENDCMVRGVVFDVVWSKASPLLLDIIKEYQPHIVISLGLANERDEVSIETKAINLNSMIKDEENKLPESEKVVEADEKEKKRDTLLPVSEIQSALDDADIPNGTSENAGGFLCNHVFYSGVHYAETDFKAREIFDFNYVVSPDEMYTGFIHFPLEDTINGTYVFNEDNLRDIVDKIIKAVIDNYKTERKSVK